MVSIFSTSLLLALFFCSSANKIAFISSKSRPSLITTSVSSHQTTRVSSRIISSSQRQNRKFSQPTKSLFILHNKILSSHHGHQRLSAKRSDSSEYLASLSNGADAAVRAAENDIFERKNENDVVVSIGDVTANETDAVTNSSSNIFFGSADVVDDDNLTSLIGKIIVNGDTQNQKELVAQDDGGSAIHNNNLMGKEEKNIDDDDYENSMLIPLRSDVVDNSYDGDDDRSTIGGGQLKGSHSSYLILSSGETTATAATTETPLSPQKHPSTSSSTENSPVASSTTSDESIDNVSNVAVDSGIVVTSAEKIAISTTAVDTTGGRATHSLLKEGESPESSTAATTTSTPAPGGQVARFLRRKLLSRIYQYDENEEQLMTKEEQRQKWTEWMTSGRKHFDHDVAGSGGSSTSSSSTSTSTDVSLDESLLNIGKGEDYVVVALPAEAVANKNVGVKLSSFPGGKLFQKTVANMQRELNTENRNVTEVNAGGGDDNQIKQVDAAAVDEKKKKKKRIHKKKIWEKSEATRLEKQMKIRQQETNLEQRIREKGRVTANDWRHNMGNLFSSTILRDVRSPVLCVFTWATIWSVIHRVLSKVASGAISCKSDAIAELAGRFTRHSSLPSTPHSMMVSAMSLLLVFRTNSAYQRFAEGRKIWNDIVDTARDFSRLIKLYEFAIGTSKVRRINNLLASFPYLLRHRIRPSLMSMRRVNDPEYERDPENSLLLYPDASLRDTDPDVAALAYDGEEAGKPSRRMKRELCWVDKRTLPWKLLPGTALELCARAQNRPLWVCDRMAKELVVVDDVLPKWTNRERLALIGYVDKLSRSIGACERIHQTVVPLNYARHALRSLTVWLWTLPFVLVKDLGLLTGPVVAVLSWILFGVYEIGSRIEDPFQGTLRLSIYCDAIRRDVLTDAIARDTAFELEEEIKVSIDDEGDEDAIFELDSESEEYGGDDIPLRNEKKKKEKKKKDWGFKLL